MRLYLGMAIQPWTRFFHEFFCFSVIPGTLFNRASRAFFRLSVRRTLVFGREAPLVDRFPLFARRRRHSLSVWLSSFIAETNELQSVQRLILGFPETGTILTILLLKRRRKKKFEVNLTSLVFLAVFLKIPHFCYSFSSPLSSLRVFCCSFSSSLSLFSAWRPFFCFCLRWKRQYRAWIQC